MTVEELIIYGKKFVSSSKAKILLANILNYNTLELFLHLDQVVEQDDIDKYKKHIDAVLNQYPIQYLTGKVNFYGYEFKVTDKVLIPRFETEQLVFRVLNFIRDRFHNNVKIIDLGCGSGVIGITLAKELGSNLVTCLDISDDAIKLTEENAKSLGVNINVQKGNMLESIQDKFDVIVSNPPYIALNEEIDEIVRNNEPHLALFAGADGLDYYRQILETVKNNVNNKFLIAFEIGYKQAESVSSLAYENLENIKVEVFRDLSGKDRIVLIYN